MDDLFLGLVKLGSSGHPDANGNLDRRDAGSDSELGRFDVLADIFGTFIGHFNGGFWHEHGELFAAKSGDYIIIAHRGLQGFGDSKQDFISGQVAVGVIDVTQQIKIGHQYRERTIEALCARQLVLQLVNEIGIIVQAGLGVYLGLALQCRYTQGVINQIDGCQEEQDGILIEIPDQEKTSAHYQQCQVDHQRQEVEDARLDEILATRQPDNDANHQMVEQHECKHGHDNPGHANPTEDTPHRG